MNHGHHPPVNYAELLALADDRQRAAWLERALRDQAQRIVEAACTGITDDLEQPDKAMLDRLGADTHRSLSYNAVTKTWDSFMR